jgi:hypothetical protein
MKAHTLLVLICLSLFTPSLFAQTAPPIPEEARKHFVMGETMFKEAKSTDNFSQAAGEFTEAARLAPQWPEARYNLALAKEAAGDYSGAMADLKLYQQFKLSESEARKVQDKIYAIEAKQRLKTSDAAAKAAADTAKVQAQAAADAARKKALEPHFEGTWALCGGNYLFSRDSSANYMLSSADLSNNTHNLTGFRVDGRKISFADDFQMARGGNHQRLTYDLALSDDGEKLVGSTSIYYYSTRESFTVPCPGSRTH